MAGCDAGDSGRSLRQHLAAELACLVAAPRRLRWGMVDRCRCTRRLATRPRGGGRAGGMPHTWMRNAAMEGPMARFMAVTHLAASSLVFASSCMVRPVTTLSSNRLPPCFSSSRCTAKKVSNRTFLMTPSTGGQNDRVAVGACVGSAAALATSWQRQHTDFGLGARPEEERAILGRQHTASTYVQHVRVGDGKLWGLHLGGLTH